MKKDLKNNLFFFKQWIIHTHKINALNQKQTREKEREREREREKERKRERMREVENKFLISER